MPTPAKTLDRKGVSGARFWLLAAAIAGSLAGTGLPSEAVAQGGGRVEAAVRAAAKSDRQLRTFYAQRGHRPMWVRGGELDPAAQQLVDLVASASLDGLDPERYRPDQLVDRIGDARSGSPKALARAEMLLSRTFAAYVRDVRRAPSVKMTYIDRELAPVQPSVASALAAAAAAPSLSEHLDAMPWVNPLYRQLRTGLESHSESSSELARIDIPAGPMLRPGASGERVRLLRLRLGLDDDSDSYDAELAQRVRSFQASHGLPSDGVAGARTLAALNQRASGPANAEQIIRLNLERARALPADPGRRYIVVDAASQRLWLYEDGRVRETMKVVVGKPTEQTPMLAGLMRYVVVNPYWNVPPDLVRVRIAPNVQKNGQKWFRKMGYEAMSGWSDDARKLDPAKIDWAAVASGRQELAVRQLPGGKNAMGRMKFMMPNDLGIYLHDTPERELFAKAERRFSSGCVRLEDAPRLARALFGKPLAPRTGKPEERVNLAEAVPVYITYLTAAPSPGGITFAADGYGRDPTQLAQVGIRAGSR
jgi:murein L,D-transpeptidase YcbB/YkuD